MEDASWSSALFERNSAEKGERLLIRSKCKQCGVSALLSHADGSLEQWEREHTPVCPHLPDAV
jgi:hypothetical protein